jgi:electron-transferring-flavoprotein dehydrogenase
MTEPRRDELEVDVLFVGAGPGSLAGALRLAQLLEERERDGRPLGEFTVAVIEKAAEPGFHSCSGAVLDPKALAELLPGYRAMGCPIEGDVVSDETWYLHEQTRVRLPFTPPSLRNHGFHVVSLGRLVRWLWDLCEKSGRVNLFPATPGSELLWDGDRVVGVRTGDKGVDRHGNRKANFEPGIDIKAKVTVLGEGARGSLAKTAISKLRLDEGRHAQVYSIGIKELWQMPRGTVEPGRVIHALGWPLRDKTYGGAFIYTMADDIVDVGMVVGLDYEDPLLEPHALFQKLKTHPEIRKLIEGGKMIQYGAKALTEGGWWSIPRPFAPGLLLVGDSASFLNPMRLKGIHTAMKTGMLAAETALETLHPAHHGEELVHAGAAHAEHGAHGGHAAHGHGNGHGGGGHGGGHDDAHDEHAHGHEEPDPFEEPLSIFWTKVQGSWVGEEMRFARNFHAGFHHGTLGGVLNAAAIQATNGEGIFGRGSGRPGHEAMRTVERWVDDNLLGDESATFRRPKYDGVLTFDKLTDVFHSGTKHDEDQPCHLKVADTDLCVTRCAQEYQNPCTRFCPAQVYNIVEDKAAKTGKRLQIDFANCVHCKTCDIADPYQVITWVPPAGGDGPRYDRL